MAASAKRIGILKRLQNPWFVGFLLAVAAVVFFHVWQIASLPSGLYQDESAIGLNASLIARTGYDEHKAFMPLYFESFGDFKSPVYIYTVAFLFRILGPSICVLRLTSAFYFFAFLLGLILLVRRMSPAKYREIQSLFAVLAGGFLPWFFTISRISFEVISEVTIFTWALYCLHCVFEAPAIKQHRAWAIATGLLLGLSVYTYPTARLLTFGLLCAIGVLYTRKKTVRDSLMMLGAFCVSLIPYGLYIITHAGAVTARFRSITYLYDSSLSFFGKIQTFSANYLKHFSLDFLILQGDGNHRHAIGYGGQVFMIVLLLAFVALFRFLSKKQTKADSRFPLLLFCGLLLGPLASALTNDGIPHALRSVLLGLFILLLSCCGLLLLLQSLPMRQSVIAACIVMIATCIEAGSYMRAYFIDYPKQSIGAFESYDLEGALRMALSTHPHSITVDTSVNSAHIEWLKELLPENDADLIHQGPLAADPGTCTVALWENQPPNLEAAHVLTTSDESRFTAVCY